MLQTSSIFINPLVIRVDVNRNCYDKRHTKEVSYAITENWLIITLIRHLRNTHTIGAIPKTDSRLLLPFILYFELNPIGLSSNLLNKMYFAQNEISKLRIFKVFYFKSTLLQ